MRVALCYDLLRFSLCSGDLCVCLLQAFTIPPPPNKITLTPLPDIYIHTYIYITDMYPLVKLHVSASVLYVCMHVCMWDPLITVHSLPNSGRVVPSDEHNLCCLLELLGLFLCPLFYTSLYVVNMSTIHYEIDVCTLWNRCLYMSISFHLTLTLIQHLFICAWYSI